ncbi:MAG TPA: hypothetical protein VFZ24_06630 [Longimicrobiales bacterium]
MFEEWKQAWRQAVDNFQREVAGGAPPRIRAMERELTSAAGALGRLEDEIRRTRRDLERERHEEHVCRRRENLARGVGDDETARIADEYARRHAERAGVLDRKITVLEEERGLLVRDVDSMRKTLAEIAPAEPQRGVAGGTSAASADDDDPGHREFSRMEREARERAADARLEELKRKMKQ